MGRDSGSESEVGRDENLYGKERGSMHSTGILQTQQTLAYISASLDFSNTQRSVASWLKQCYGIHGISFTCTIMESKGCRFDYEVNCQIG